MAKNIPRKALNTLKFAKKTTVVPKKAPKNSNKKATAGTATYAKIFRLRKTRVNAPLWQSVVKSPMMKIIFEYAES